MFATSFDKQSTDEARTSKSYAIKTQQQQSATTP